MDGFGAGGIVHGILTRWISTMTIVLMARGPGAHCHRPGQDEGPPAVVYHGRVGAVCRWKCPSKHGPVTLLSVVQTADGPVEKLLVAEGSPSPDRYSRSQYPTAVNGSASGARRFVESWNVHGPAHHCAVGVGQHRVKDRQAGQVVGNGISPRVFERRRRARSRLHQLTSPFSSHVLVSWGAIAIVNKARDLPGASRLDASQ